MNGDVEKIPCDGNDVFAVMVTGVEMCNNSYDIMSLDDDVAVTDDKSIHLLNDKIHLKSNVKQLQDLNMGII